MSSSNERNSENASDDGQNDNSNNFVDQSWSHTLSLNHLAQSTQHANISNQQQQVGPQTQSLQLNQYQAAAGIHRNAQPPTSANVSDSMASYSSHSIPSSSMINGVSGNTSSNEMSMLASEGQNQEYYNQLDVQQHINQQNIFNPSNVAPSAHAGATWRDILEAQLQASQAHQLQDVTQPLQPYPGTNRNSLQRHPVSHPNEAGGIQSFTFKELERAIESPAFNAQISRNTYYRPGSSEGGGSEHTTATTSNQGNDATTDSFDLPIYTDQATIPCPTCNSDISTHQFGRTLYCDYCGNPTSLK